MIGFPEFSKPLLGSSAPATSLKQTQALTPYQHLSWYSDLSLKQTDAADMYELNSIDSSSTQKPPHLSGSIDIGDPDATVPLAKEMIFPDPRRMGSVNLGILPEWPNTQTDSRSHIISYHKEKHYSQSTHVINLIEDENWLGLLHDLSYLILSPYPPGFQLARFVGWLPQLFGLIGLIVVIYRFFVGHAGEEAAAALRLTNAANITRSQSNAAEIFVDRFAHNQKISK
ncbi:unnamed protein product [Protopolystoma xenopodis]|uniref:Uncharacterized protein n=1 Tax=Protopolystoma xenopodis TaxID=117903 RepID=A0A3S5A4B3_9PLAT|nr:unnamed protein product [Protopolystoma xenopodis]